MKILGANLATTHFGMKLNDGGACLLEDGKIKIAISEERLTRNKYDAGFKEAIKYCLTATENTVDDIDLFVFSSCSEPARFPKDQLPCTFPIQDVEILGIPREKVSIIPSHHLSHAYSSFSVSPFNDAIIIVMDGEGNSVGEWTVKEGSIDLMDTSGSLTGKKKGIAYWKNTLERQSYYLGKGDTIECVDKELGKSEIGLGEAYRYFTNFLGFGAYVNAGKTMALATYGKYDTFKDIQLFELDRKNHIRCELQQNYENPNSEILRLMEEYGVEDVLPRLSKTDLITQTHMDLAFLIQDKLNKIIVEKVNVLYNEFKINKLCIAGGVGLNCVMNRYILDNTAIKNIFIQPASGDSGQCIGNTYYGYLGLMKESRKYVMKSASLGKEYKEKDIRNAFESFKDRVVFIEYSEDEIAKIAARLLSKGSILGWFQGKSEMGPRALGNRSILADPRIKKMKEIINDKIKHREWFRPFAPSILLKYAGDYFEIKNESPFMLLTAKIKESKKDVIPAVIHVDGSARLQTVTKENGIFYNLIEEFNNITKVPVLLNTSFNLSGEPIVESPTDALNCFVNSNIDYLIISNYLVKKHSL